MAENSEGRPSTTEKDWQQSKAARTYMNSIFKKKKRVHFGLLEDPTHISSYVREATTHSCKMFLYGKTGLGKTSTVMKLTGQPIPGGHHETIGIQTTAVYWPFKLANSTEDQVEMLHLELWDTGERAMIQYNYIIPSCLRSTDCIAFFFSYNDRKSWEELPCIIEETGHTGSHLKVVIATNADALEWKVTREEMDRFESDHHIKILSISNDDSSSSSDDTSTDITDICHFLNSLAELVVEHEHKSSSFDTGTRARTDV